MVFPPMRRDNSLASPLGREMSFFHWLILPFCPLPHFCHICVLLCFPDLRTVTISLAVMLSVLLAFLVDCWLLWWSISSTLVGLLGDCVSRSFLRRHSDSIRLQKAPRHHTEYCCRYHLFCQSIITGGMVDSRDDQRSRDCESSTKNYSTSS
jgi:hypothetical protein